MQRITSKEVSATWPRLIAGAVWLNGSLSKTTEYLHIASDKSIIYTKSQFHTVRMVKMENILDSFQSMDELKACVESMKHSMSAEDYEFLLYVCGLLENRAISDTVLLHGEEVKIDRHLIPMIADLNEKGIITMASCSGLKAEHPKERFRPESGYLAIQYDPELLDFLQHNLKDPLIKVEEGRCYLKLSVSIQIKGGDDTILKEKWALVWEALKSWKPT